MKPSRPILLNSVPRHPWIGKFLFDPKQPHGQEFRGIIKEVSDDGAQSDLYVRFTYNDAEDDFEINDYAFVPRNALVEPAMVRVS